MWLVEHTVRIVVAVRILIPDPSGNTHLGVGVQSTEPALALVGHLVAVVVLAGYQQYPLVEAADDRDLRLLLSGGSAGLLLLRRMVGSLGSGRRGALRSLRRGN